MIIVNNGHRDFVYASRSKALKLRYLVRLYAKELVLHNFAGLPAINCWNGWWSFRSARRSIFRTPGTPGPFPNTHTRC